MEGDVGEAGRFDAGGGGLEDFGVLVHPYHTPRRAVELGGEEGHVAGPASHVEYLHALFDAGALEQAPGEGTVEPVLRHQAPGLGLATAHHVGAGFGGHHVYSSLVFRLKDTLSCAGMGGIGRITRTCGSAQHAQNYLIRTLRAGTEGNSDQGELTRLLDGRGPALDPELAVATPQMPACGAGAHVKLLGHLGVGEALGD